MYRHRCFDWIISAAVEVQALVSQLLWGCRPLCLSCCGVAGPCVSAAVGLQALHKAVLLKDSQQPAQALLAADPLDAAVRTNTEVSKL